MGREGLPLRRAVRAPRPRLRQHLVRWQLLLTGSDAAGAGMFLGAGCCCRFWRGNPLQCLQSARDARERELVDAVVVDVFESRRVLCAVEHDCDQLHLLWWMERHAEESERVDS